MKVQALTTATLLALSVPATLALPSTRTLRGVSPYQALHYPDTLPQGELKNLPKNRGRVQEAVEEHILQYRHPKWDFYTDKVRPEWADKMVNKLSQIVDRLDGLSSTLGLNMAALSHVTHWLTPKRQYPKYHGYKKIDLSHVLGDALSSDRNVTIQGRLPNASGFPYGDPNHPVRGVNLGNWLLFELWMDPNLNTLLNDHAVNAPYYGAIVDEYTAGLYSDPAFLTQTLNDHFNTWITEADFKAMAAAGLNHVRIPIGYWAFPDLIGSAPYVAANRFDVLKQACGWAQQNGIKVWVDFHGLPGSQNGFDNSGRSGPIDWPYQADYYTVTQTAFERLVDEFSKPQYVGTVTAIEPVNEPQAQGNGDVKNLLNTYYPWAHGRIAHPNNDNSISSNLTLACHDGFLGLGYWQNFWTGNNRDRVLMDKHPYFVYSSAEKQMKDTARLQEACALSDEIWTSNQYYPSIMGEWSTSGPNGDNNNDRDIPVDTSPVQFPAGPNYPYSQEYMVFLSKNFDTQTQTYEYNAAGWIYWSWSNQGAADWSYQTGLQYGWIPPVAGQYRWGGDICNNL